MWHFVQPLECHVLFEWPFGNYYSALPVLIFFNQTLNFNNNILRQWPTNLLLNLTSEILQPFFS